MNILRHITVRRMLLIILTLFTVIWGMASIFTLGSFSSMINLLNDNMAQKKSYSTLVKGNDQYFRSVTRMLRVVDYLQIGDTENAQKTLSAADSALKNSKEALEQFKRSEHIGVDKEIVQQMGEAWGRLLQSGVEPMLTALKNGQMDDFRQLFRKQYPPLSVDFGGIADKYATAIQSDDAIISASKHLSLNKELLLAALILGIIVLFLSDRYLVNYLVKPLGQIKRHLELLTSGKLGVELDEFGRNCAGQLIPYIRAMQSNLRNTVQTIHDSSSVIYSGS
ncbi:Tar ligand binding domain-containing protein, partial [Dickeya poaceiphila]